MIILILEKEISKMISNNILSEIFYAILISLNRKERKVISPFDEFAKLSKRYIDHISTTQMKWLKNDEVI